MNMNATKNSQARLLGILPALAGLVLPSIAPVARADEQDTLNIQWVESFAHDNNLFRLPSGVDPASVGLDKSKRSDNIRTDSLGLTADKQYSLQRFHLGARFDNYSFSNYDFLDYNTKNIDGRWDWALTPHITGQLGADRVQSFNNFADYQTYIRSVRTTDSIRGNAEFGTGGALRFVIGANQSKTTNSKAIQEDNDTRSRSANGGLRYVTTAGNSVGYLYRRYSIEWINRDLNPVLLYDTQASQADHELNLHWNLAGQAALDGAIARIKRSHDHFEERDFSGTNARLSLNWLPDAQWRLGAYARREYSTWWSTTASYVITDTYGVTPSWQITDKITFFGKAEYSQRKFPAPIIPTAESRRDKTSLYQLGLDWQVIRNLTVGGSVENSRRSSNASGLDFTDTTASIHAQMTF
jgi:exopolysaccharide biosynthesis operon protein EpsL